MTTACCGICGRDLVDWREAEHNDPAMDCGGDCLACMIDVEHGMGYIPSDRATLGIMARTSYGVRLTAEQAARIREIQDDADPR